MCGELGVHLCILPARVWLLQESQGASGPQCCLSDTNFALTSHLKGWLIHQLCLISLRLLMCWEIRWKQNTQGVNLQEKFRSTPYHLSPVLLGHRWSIFLALFPFAFIFIDCLYKDNWFSDFVVTKYCPSSLTIYSQRALSGSDPESQ